MIIGFAFLALASLGLIIKNNVGASNIITLLLILASTSFMASEITPIESKGTFVGLVGIYLAVNLLLGALISKSWLKFIAPLGLLGIFYVLGNKEWMYLNYSMDFTQPKVLMLPVFGILLLILLEIKKLAVHKFFPELEMAKLESVVVLVFLAFVTIFATFLGSWISFLLLAIGVFAFNAYSDSNRNYISLALIAFALMGGFIQKYQLESVDLTIGKTIAGLLVGAGSMGMLILAQKVNKWIWSIVFGLMGASLLLAILMLNNVHPAFGGIEPFVASLAGLALVGLWSRNGYSLAFILPIAVIFGLTMYNDPFAQTETKTEVEKTEQSDTKVEEKNLVASTKGEDWSLIKGNYTIDESSVISFQLGPKGGITKGEITKIEGKVSISETLENTEFKVEMKVKNLSTFNSMRDESLMEADYFDEPKFPKMRFVSKNMEAKDDGFVLKGNFEMLGKKMPQDVFVKYAGEKNGKKYFVGNASLDKTDFGMASSPQEGDVVDFEISLFLK